MIKRIVFGLAIIGVLAGLLGWDASLSGGRLAGLPLAALAALLVVSGFFELAAMLSGASLAVMPLVGGLCAAAVATRPWWSRHLAVAVDPTILLALVVSVCFFAQMARYRLDSAMKRLAGTFFGILYLGVLTEFILKIRMEAGVSTLLAFLAVVKATDIGAYFTGTMIGRHKIIPWLSPGKSWEGLIGGIIASVAVTCAAAGYLKPDAGFVWALGFGIAMTLIGQFGDLCESLIKRDGGVKDSAVLIPEFGGVLDLIDSPLAAAPAAALMLGLL